MELKIGDNIKRLRKNKGMTQEQLSELLNISCAAVSKWESADTYPDITMIMPLARIFDVSIDELIGYNSAKVEAEVERTITDHRQLQASGKYKEATELIKRARRAYPNDYRIMSSYVWDLAGGSADNSPETINIYHDEFLQICDCILSDCTDEGLRLEAMTMKAKLLHTAGNTAAAIEIIAQFPSWYQSSGQKAEQLFAKDTLEFRYYLKRNLYELSAVTANKMIKTIWYEDGITMEERVARCEKIGDMFTELRKQSDESFFIIIEHMVFAELSGKLTFSGGSIGDIRRTREKCLVAARELSNRAQKDSILNELLIKTYKSDDLLSWTVNWLTSSSQDSITRLRNNPEYMAMLDKFIK